MLLQKSIRNYKDNKNMFIKFLTLISLKYISANKNNKIISVPRKIINLYPNLEISLKRLLLQNI